MTDTRPTEWIPRGPAPEVVSYKTDDFALVNAKHGEKLIA